MTDKLAIPTIHLNGTSSGELIGRLSDAARAIREANDKLRLAWPHGRDYYTQPFGALMLAETQMRMRMAKLDAIHAELEEIVNGIMDQVQ